MTVANELEYDFPKWMAEALVGYCVSCGPDSPQAQAFIRGDGAVLSKAMEEMAERLLAERDNLERAMDQDQL